MKTKTARIFLYHVYGTAYHTWRITYRGRVIVESQNDGEYLGKCAGLMVATAARVAYNCGYRAFIVELASNCGDIH